MKQGWIYKYKFAIGGIILIAAILVLKKLSKPKKTEMTLGNNSEDIGDGIIVSTPVTKIDAYPLIVVFGGISYATPKWIFAETPKDLLSMAMVAFVPYTMSYVNAKKRIDNYLQTKKIEVNTISIVGFSAGALNVQKVYEKTFKFVGLIDPSSRSEYVSLPFSNNVSMVYNDSNWGGYPEIKKTLPKLSKSIQDGGGDSEKVSLGHAKIPAYFFNKYKNQIV